MTSVPPSLNTVAPVELAESEPLRMTEVNFTLLALLMYCLIVFGLFGNINLIIVVYRRKEFQSKCGVLVAILAFCDSVCLAWETLSATRMITDTTQMRRLMCFWTTSPYVFIMNIGAYLMVAIAFDRVFAILSPIKYRVLSTRNYVFLCCVPGFLYSVALVSYAIITLDNEQIPACILPIAYSAASTEIWNRGVMFFAAATFICYLAGYIVLTKRARALKGIARRDMTVEAKYVRDQVKIMRTLGTMMLLFVLSWCVAHSIVFGAEFFPLQTMLALKTYAVLPVLTTYTQSYYVYFWRSREYREAFLVLFGLRNWMWFFKPPATSTVRPSPPMWKTDMHSMAGRTHLTTEKKPSMTTQS